MKRPLSTSVVVAGGKKPEVFQDLEVEGQVEVTPISLAQRGPELIDQVVRVVMDLPIGLHKLPDDRYCFFYSLCDVLK